MSQHKFKHRKSKIHAQKIILKNGDYLIGKISVIPKSLSSESSISSDVSRCNYDSYPPIIFVNEIRGNPLN